MSIHESSGGKKSIVVAFHSVSSANFFRPVEGGSNGGVPYRKVSDSIINFPEGVDEDGKRVAKRRKRTGRRL